MNDSNEERIRSLANQGQTWKFVEKALEFARPAPILDQPLEITISQLRGLRFVDETIVVHGDINLSNK